MRRPAAPKSRGATSAFTLVELLVVASIMAIMMGLLAVSLTQSQGRALQMASAQVASGMGLARQLAITKNTTALFLVAPKSGGAAGDFYPQEAFRYWAVVFSNRDQNSWTLAKDWEPLPSGTVFMGLTGEGYNTLKWNTDGQLPTLGQAFAPTVGESTKGEWKFFNSFTDARVVWPGGSTNLRNIPFIGFRSSGAGYAWRPPNRQQFPLKAMALVLGEGAPADGDRILLRSTNNITHVETDDRAGRVLVRARDSYR